MITIDKNTPNDTSLAALPLYIKIDWGHFETLHDITYVINGFDSKRGHDGVWDVRFTIRYLGTKESKTIKYINITVQAYDRVDEPIGEIHETKFTGPLEPQSFAVHDCTDFWKGDDYRTLGSIKAVKIVIVYMDKTEEEITGENTIKAICDFSVSKFVDEDDYDDDENEDEDDYDDDENEDEDDYDEDDYDEDDYDEDDYDEDDEDDDYDDEDEDDDDDEHNIRSLQIPIKLAVPAEPPFYMHIDDEYDQGKNRTQVKTTIVYIGENNSKTIKFIDFVCNFYRTDGDISKNRLRSSKSILPRHKLNYVESYIGNCQIARLSVENILITYEDNTYLDVPKSMIDAMTSVKNFDKAEMKLNEILREAEEVKKKAEETQKKKENARRNKCLSEIESRTHNFRKTPNELNATSLLDALNEYCPNDAVMAANYLTKDNINKVCADSLMVMAFDTIIKVTQKQRNTAKAYLTRFATKLNSEAAFNKFKENSSNSIYQRFEKCANEILNKPNDHTAQSLLNELNEYCPNNEKMYSNYLTKDRVASACGEALQKMAFDTDNMVTQAHRNKAKSFLVRIAPELNTVESYNAFKERWRNNILIDIKSYALKLGVKKCTAKDLLGILAQYCRNDETMTANYLTKELLAPACGEAIQEIAYDPNINVTETQRNDAKSLLARIAPELNSLESFKKTSNRKAILGILIALIPIVIFIIIFILFINYIL